MQHNLHDLMRFGTHLLHSSQTIVKAANKRDLVVLPCFEVSLLDRDKELVVPDNDDPDLPDN